jgi:hypothetical protein
VIPTLFFPSIVFWTSGVIKESIAIGALAGVIALLTNTYYKKKISWATLISILVGLFILASLKYYYAAVLIVTALTLFLTRVLLPNGSKIWKEAMLMLLIFISFLGIASLSHINFWPSRFLGVIVENYNQFQVKSPSENLITYQNLEPTILSFIINSPKALFTGLFYPVWSTSLNLVKILSVLENWLVVLLFIYSLKKLRLPKEVDTRLLVGAMVLFAVVTAIFISYSTPNIGTLVRYKVGYHFVFIILLLGNIRFDKKA